MNNIEFFKVLARIGLLIAVAISLVVLLCEHPLTFITGYLIATIVSWVVIPFYILSQLGSGLDNEYYILEEGVDAV